MISGRLINGKVTNVASCAPSTKLAGYGNALVFKWSPALYPTDNSEYPVGTCFENDFQMFNVDRILIWFDPRSTRYKLHTMAECIPVATCTNCDLMARRRITIKYSFHNIWKTSEDSALNQPPGNDVITCPLIWNNTLKCECGSYIPEF